MSPQNSLLFFSVLFNIISVICCNHIHYSNSVIANDGYVENANLKEFIRYSDEVLNAIENNKPIVALESTIISHGMPYPQNVETAIEVENIIRSEGITPATICILNGEILIGLNEEQLDILGREGKKAKKTSRRDIAKVLSQKEVGATTVASTMILANMVGIQVFVTGGIGGVHKDGETTMDISADLMELHKTPVAVVCAGAKSILDIGLTLEFLETCGVPVIGYETEEFPAFFTRSSGYPSPITLNSVEDIVSLLDWQFNKLELQTGVVIGIPIPVELEADGQKVEIAITQAIKESNEQNIVGKELTPFLLKRVNELTNGESLTSNIALVKNNALVGAKIAKQLHDKK
eukprot:TRINITY_DN6967_c0_g1_i1.p1 TRINITY_DN6967_c0_g1~~TRINITY_DN6967_c0_g1_i1.p1  ORF type:complete len:349 (-),score=117.56 TRINITY_DN6967_c0_g1_i1:19-1065(-)